MDATTTEQTPKNAVSIDDHFSDLARRKKRAVRLLKKPHALSDEDLEFAARVIYESTFSRLLSADFRNGCEDPYGEAMKEVLSYGLKQGKTAEEGYPTAALARPAYWFAIANLIQQHTERLGTEDGKPMERHSWKWKPSVNGNLSGFVEQYIPRFDGRPEVATGEGSKPYMVANLKGALGFVTKSRR